MSENFVDFLLRLGTTSRLCISRCCILQTIRKHHEFHTVATKPGAGCPPKVTDRQKRLIKLQQLRDDTLSLNDLVQYAYTELNLTVHRQTVSCILRGYDMVSYIAPKKPQITPTQRRVRLQWCYKHLSWSEKDWSNVIFSDESNYEILNRKNRIYIRRFRNDPSQLVHHELAYAGCIKIIDPPMSFAEKLILYFQKRSFV